MLICVSWRSFFWVLFFLIPKTSVWWRSFISVPFFRISKPQTRKYEIINRTENPQKLKYPELTFFFFYGMLYDVTLIWCKFSGFQCSHKFWLTKIDFSLLMYLDHISVTFHVTFTWFLSLQEVLTTTGLDEAIDSIDTDTTIL